MEIVASVREREEAFLQALVTSMPGIDAKFGPSPDGWLCSGTNEAPIAQLFSQIEQMHPAAGPAYWAVRSWSMLVWQPAMSAILAAHGHGLVLAVDRMSQRVADGGVYGFRLTPGESLCMEDEAEVVRHAAAGIRRMADIHLAGLERITLIKRKIALRLLADRILSTLIHLDAEGPRPDLREMAEAWLRAADLSGMSALDSVHLDDGSCRPILGRKACCLHYLCEPGVLCQSCPKQTLDVRQSRMRDYWRLQSAA